MAKSIALIGAPADCGGRQRGCVMGPDALRTAGLVKMLSSLGHIVTDRGNLTPKWDDEQAHDNAAIHDLTACSAWVAALVSATFDAGANGQIPLTLGGDHIISAGTVSGAARRAAASGREQFVLWLDAHTDFHTLDTTQSGNLHGTPVAYFCGQSGFDGFYPPLQSVVKPENVCMMGIRSVDVRERDRVVRGAVDVCDMRLIDEEGVAFLLRRFLERVRDVDGQLHVSLDVDFLDPAIAPAVGTTVPGGATFREAHLVMEMLHDSDLVTSLDIAELNPFLDDRGQTAKLIVDLIASLFGQRVIDRPTRSF